MTRDELKQLAREVGAEITDFIDYHYDDEVVVFEKDQLERFTAIIAKTEWEACLEAVKRAKEHQIIWYPKGSVIDANDIGRMYAYQHEQCVAAIRARGNS
jgi:hypothetical protein